MTVRRQTQTISVYDTEYAENGIDVISEIYVGEREIEVIMLIADEGKLLVEKETGKVLSNTITLGTEDSEKNYTEV